MSKQNDNQLKDGIEKNTEFQASNGQTIGFRDYLNKAIEAFDLKPIDYYSAFFILRKVAEEKKADEIVKQIKDFWESLEKKYGV